MDTMFDVVGVGWPNVDEDAYRDMADTLREFADDAGGRRVRHSSADPAAAVLGSE
ncbi:hypothetical protein [Streptomyces niveus]|uniref:hypothetical protein n=1 Tax=Streptomyces niveus TaxID=193462 RepID=UPI00406495B7